MVQICFWTTLIKFIYSDKATKFCEISTLLLFYVKSKVEISQNFAAFSECMNFKDIVQWAGPEPKWNFGFLRYDYPLFCPMNASFAWPAFCYLLTRELAQSTYYLFYVLMPPSIKLWLEESETFIVQVVYNFLPAQKLVHLSGYSSPLKSHMGVVNFPKMCAKSFSL